jgi:hypothetical protein
MTLPASARDWSAAWLAPATLAETSVVPRLLHAAGYLPRRRALLLDGGGDRGGEDDTALVA